METIFNPIPLNFPPIPLKITRKGNQFWIWDTFRKKNIVLTPEEWVRQHVAHWLIQEHHISKNRISLEIGFTLNGLSKRVDIMVFDSAMNPIILVECKRPEVTIDDTVYQQAVRYNLVWRVPQLLLTNGIDSKFLEVTFED